MDDTLLNDNLDPEVIEEPAVEPESAPGIYSGADSGVDYQELIYEYLTEQTERQEEMHTEQINMMQDIHTALEWNVSFMMLIVVLMLFRSVRSWSYRITGGLKDVL